MMPYYMYIKNVSSLSYLPWFEVFYKLLNILADCTVKGQESQWQELLVSLHTLPIPEPGVPVHLGVHSFFTVPDIKELPSIPENRNLTEYFVAVDVNNMLHLYASMLYERRILICCSKLSTLTACVHGSAAMLYPMYWQHVYIPVLPQHLLDYCCPRYTHPEFGSQLGDIYCMSSSFSLCPFCLHSSKGH
uniref:UDENN domain-containing protein n=1 Tax=Poecilia mexicana TaxID=48701 RepID=A0A3B3Z2J4_9TELE